MEANSIAHVLHRKLSASNSAERPTSPNDPPGDEFNRNRTNSSSPRIKKLSLGEKRTESLPETITLRFDKSTEEHFQPKDELCSNEKSATDPTGIYSRKKLPERKSRSHDQSVAKFTLPALPPDPLGTPKIHINNQLVEPEAERSSSREELALNNSNNPFPSEETKKWIKPSHQHSYRPFLKKTELTKMVEKEFFEESNNKILESKTINRRKSENYIPRPKAHQITRCEHEKSGKSSLLVTNSLRSSLGDIAGKEVHHNNLAMCVVSEPKINFFLNRNKEDLLAQALESRNNLQDFFKRNFHMDLETMEFVVAAKKHHKNLNSFLKEVWPKINKPRVSAEIIENQIHNYVASEIKALFKHEICLQEDLTDNLNSFIKEQEPWPNAFKPLVSAEIIENRINNKIKPLFNQGICLQEYDRDERERMVLLLSMIQKNGVALQEIYPRLIILRQLVEFYHHLEKGKSGWGITLQTLLYKLTNIVDVSESNLHTGKEIDKFINICNEAIELTKNSKDSKSENVERWVLASFGDSQLEIEGVLRVLRKWSLCLDHNAKDEVIDELKVIAWKVASLEYFMSKYSNIVHHWYQDPNCQNNISKITIIEIARCIKPGEYNRIIFDRLTVNDQVIWDVKQSNGEEFKLGNKEFYSTLFAAFSRKKEIEKEHMLQATFFIAAANESCYDVPEFTDQHVPWLGLMRLTSNSNWGFGDQYLRKLIPGIFELPYWTKYEPGIECHIKVDKDGHYVVTQVRRMAVCLRQDQYDINSRVPGEVQLRFHISWEVQPTRQGWVGRLWISDIEDVAEEHLEDIKQRMTKIAIIDPMKDQLAGTEFSTAYPFSKKECKLMHIQIQQGIKRSISLSSLSRDLSFDRTSTVSKDSKEDKLIIKC